LFRLGAVCLAVLAVAGMLKWRSDLDVHQETRSEYSAIVSAATARDTSGVRRTVIMYQPPAERRTVRGSTMAGTLRMMVREADGVVPRWCRPAECSVIASRAAEGPVIRLGTVNAVIVPHPPAWFGRT
jgi:hypothetical protein